MKKKLSIIIAIILVMTSLGSVYGEEITMEEGLNKLQSLIYFAQNNYYQELSNEEILDAAYDGIFDPLDPHSVYFSKSDYESFTQSSEGFFYGVGVSIEPEGDYIRVISPIDGSPASKEDIQPGDILKTVNGIDLKGISLDEAVTMIRGKEGTPVTLGFQREGLQDLVVITLLRGRVEMNPVTFEVKDNNIGYMRISQFSTNLTENYDKALTSLVEESKVKGLIIDLRYNPGGSLNVVLETLDRLLPSKQPILYVDYRANKDETYLTETDGLELPVVVLINEWSASASEIFAGSLQDLGRATVVGETSYGKGTVQQTYPLLDGSGFKVTVAQYLTGGKKAINGIGVKPDYIIENISYELERIKKEFAPMITYQNSIVGNKDLDTLGAQQRLNYLGNTVREDGYFDRKTELALAKFQLDKGLLNSGILNQETKKALDAAVREKAAQDIEDLQLKKAEELLNAL